MNAPSTRHAAVAIPSARQHHGAMSLSFGTALLMLLNASRADARVPAFAENPTLTACAQVRAERMCASGQFSHEGTTRPSPACATTGPARISRWLSGAVTGRRPTDELPGHRANILKHEFRAVGIGHGCNITVELFWRLDPAFPEIGEPTRSLWIAVCEDINPNISGRGSRSRLITYLDCCPK
jgi:hypothetical protein